MSNYDSVALTVDDIRSTNETNMFEAPDKCMAVTTQGSRCSRKPGVGFRTKSGTDYYVCNTHWKKLTENPPILVLTQTGALEYSFRPVKISPRAQLMKERAEAREAEALALAEEEKAKGRKKRSARMSKKDKQMLDELNTMLGDVAEETPAVRRQAVMDTLVSAMYEPLPLSQSSSMQAVDRALLESLPELDETKASRIGPIRKKKVSGATFSPYPVDKKVTEKVRKMGESYFNTKPAVKVPAQQSKQDAFSSKAMLSALGELEWEEGEYETMDHVYEEQTALDKLLGVYSKGKSSRY